MPDVLTTGVMIYPDAVEWTSLRRRKDQIEVAEQRRVPLPADDEAARRTALTAALASIKGAIATALPAEKALLRVVKFPTTDVSEIRDMAALQVDKFSPFPADQMAVGQEIVAQADQASNVLIAAALHEHVDACADVFRAAGRVPRELDIAVMGWWRLLQLERRVPETGSCLILLIDAGHAELIAVHNGAPIAIRSLGALSSADPAASAAEFAEEIGYTLTTLESEWGVPAPTSLLVWHPSSVPTAFREALQASMDLTVEGHLLDALPPLSEGLARRSLERGPHLLDLAPPDWKAAIASRRLKRNLALAAGVFFAVWLSAVATIAGGLKLAQNRLADARAELAALREPARAVEQLKEQVRSLERYMDPTFSPLECLREISERLPPGVDITALTYKKYGQVAIRGEADQSEPIYEFFSQLEKSTLFPAVKPEGVTQQQRGGKSRSQFKLTIDLPPEAK